MRTILMLMVVVAAACQPEGQSANHILVSKNTVAPGSETSILASMTAALGCGAPDLAWSIQESTTPGWDPAVDGSVTQQGVFRAPKCGSTWVGGYILHVQAYCATTALTGVAAMTTAQEVLSSLAIAEAAVSACGAATCRSLTPTAISLPLCTAGQPASTIQFYSRLNFTCGPIYVPPLPANYAAMAACP